MSGKMSRRDFVKTGTAASVAAAVPAAAFGQAPTVLVRRATPPVVISSANGHEYRNGGPRTCVEEAYQRIVKGEDVLDALIAGVNIVELDPDEMYVGYGGLPNADGVVQLDSCCMHGPLRRAGGVAALEGVRTPSRVARAVLDNTDHHLLDSKGNPSFQLIFYAVDKKGEYAGVSMYAREGRQEERFAVCTENGPELLACEPLLAEAPAE